MKNMEKLKFEYIKEIKCLRESIGKILVDITKDMYIFDGEPQYDDFNSIELRFHDNKLLTLVTLSDGESVGANCNPMKIPPSFEIGDGHFCQWEKTTLLQHVNKDDFISKRLTKVNAVLEIFENHSPVVIGWNLIFENGSNILFFNNGDDAAVCINEDPISIQTNEFMTYKIVDIQNI